VDKAVQMRTRRRRNWPMGGWWIQLRTPEPSGRGRTGHTARRHSVDMPEKPERARTDKPFPLAEYIAGHPSEDVREIAADFALSMREVDALLTEHAYPLGIKSFRAKTHVARKDTTPHPKMSDLDYQMMRWTLEGKRLSHWMDVRLATRMAVSFLTDSPGETWWDKAPDSMATLAGQIIISTLTRLSSLTPEEMTRLGSMPPEEIEAELERLRTGGDG